MDRIDHATVIKQILRDYAAIKLSYGDVETEVIENDTIGHYELRYIGWNDQRRIHDCLLHVDVKGDKVWIQHDGTPEGIAEELVEAGIPASQIVLAFHSEHERRLIKEFAVK